MLKIEVSEMKYLFLVSGPQGSGKSTQAEQLAAVNEAPLFESGHKLREMVERNEPGAREVEQYMEKGELVPHHYVDTLFTEFFARNSSSPILVSDGYPRNLPELKIVQRLCSEDNPVVIGVAINLDETTAVERIIARAQTKTDGDRPDDSPEAIRQRLNLYHEETVPVLEELRANHVLLSVDGSGTIEQVTDLMLSLTQSQISDEA